MGGPSAVSIGPSCCAAGRFGDGLNSRCGPGGVGRARVRQTKALVVCDPRGPLWLPVVVHEGGQAIVGNVGPGAPPGGRG